MLMIMNVHRTEQRQKEIGASIRRAREIAGLSQEGLGHYFGVSGAAVSRWEAGKVALDLPTLEELSRVLDQPLQFFTGQAVPRRDTEAEAIGKEVLRIVQRHGYSNVQPVTVRGARVRATSPVRIINSVAASGLMAHDRQVEDEIEVDDEILARAKEPLGFCMVGDCLSKRGIITGDIIIVDGANTEPKNGQIVVAEVDGEQTAKVFCRLDQRTVELRPTVPEYDVIAVRAPKQLRIVGVYVGFVPTGKRD